jgi:4-amino-4-deoxy-L-arabinose transferase-like glycosyltransferase
MKFSKQAKKLTNLRRNPAFFSTFAREKNSLIILGIIWLMGLIIDRIWFGLDKSVPAWDQADYLNGAMIYGNALQTPDFFNYKWWRNFWLLSNKIPPLTYILTAPFLTIFAPSADSATLVLSLFSAILLISVYALGRLFFNKQIALYACILCQLLPGLYFYRLEFLLDYPLTAIVTFSFACLSFWYFNKNQKLGWWLAILWGLSLGIGLMIKQTYLFFLFLPIIWVLVTSLIQKKWSKLIQLILSFFCSALVFFPWYRTNWLLIFTSGKRATIDSAIAEGDPALNTFGAWTYYGKVLPYLLSWHLLIIPLICLIYLGVKRVLFASAQQRNNNFNKRFSNITVKFSSRIKATSPQQYLNKQLVITWLAIFLIGGYLLSSLNINKDARYILPLLPVLSLILAASIFIWQEIGRSYLRIGTIILAGLLMIFNLFPLGGNFLTRQLSPRVQHYPYLGKPWYLEEVIQETLKTSPYLRSNIGVLPSTPEINQHNISFYGSIANFQVFGRQVGVRKEFVNQDVNSLNWFLIKTGEQGSIPQAQKTTVNLVENDGDFQLKNYWQLPDKSTLKLYHRLHPSVTVNPLESQNSKVKLEQIIIPEKAPPGLPIPVTYTWSGNWQDLEQGMVILSWYNQNNYSPAKWLHDHGIGLNKLHSGRLSQDNFKQDFQVVENTAMLPSMDLPLGDYGLKATYLNRKTGKTYPLETPLVKITLDANASPTPAPELDLVTQFRNFAPNLAQGIEGLEPIFAEVGRINQYDPIQNYLKVVEETAQFRLETEPNIDYVYSLVLARVLQQNINGAIAALNQLIKLEPDNGYHHAYLAFVYLYDWKGKEAEQALQPALKLNPEVKEFQFLDAIAATIQGNFFKAWQIYQSRENS